jgi:hypothetical protein
MFKFNNIKYSEEKLRLFLFVGGLFLILFLASYLLRIAYARYEVKAKINANIDKALYIFEDEKLDFNLESSGILPSNEPYVYKFSVSNYNASKSSDIDISYTVDVKTTTNLPITIKLYRNELYTDSSATNLFTGSSNYRDSDDSWYKLYKTNEDYTMLYKDKVTDIYTLVINFSSVYSDDTTYENAMESIEVIIDSHQVV